MKDEDGEQEKWRPWHIEEGHEGGGAKKLLHRFEIAQTGGGGLVRAHGGLSHDGFEDAVIHARLKARGDAGHDPATHMVEHAHDHIEKDNNEREANKGFDSAGAEHTIIDLQHVKRPGEHEQVAKGAKEGNGPEEAVAFAARCAQFAQACQELRVTHKVFRQNTVAAQCRC